MTVVVSNRGQMINFDEEIKKFDKSLEPEEIDEALADADITDMNDIMFKTMKKIANNQVNNI